MTQVDHVISAVGDTISLFLYSPDTSVNDNEKAAPLSVEIKVKAGNLFLPRVAELSWLSYFFECVYFYFMTHCCSVGTQRLTYLWQVAWRVTVKCFFCKQIVKRFTGKHRYHFQHVMTVLYIVLYSLALRCTDSEGWYNTLAANTSAAQATDKLLKVIWWVINCRVVEPMLIKLQILWMCLKFMQI